MIVRAKPDVNDMVRSPQRHDGIRPGDVLIVIAYSEDHVRVLDRDAEPILYPVNEFNFLDPTIPKRWVKGGGDDELYRAYPPEYEGCFFERYFDDDTETVATFRSTICRVLTESLPPDGSVPR